MSTRIIFKDLTIQNGALLISKITVIDTDTGEELRIAKITPELVDFLKRIEIDITNYFAFTEMAKKNPNLKKLVDSFNLIT